MPNTEKTFADRLGRAQLLQSTIAGFTPAFAPADTSLNAANFEDFVTVLEAANVEVNDQRDTYATKAALRTDIVREAKTRAMQAINYVKSNSAWGRHFDTLKPTYDKLRGYRPAREVVPVEPPATAAEKKAIKSGQQSYADIEGLFGKFLKALGKVPGYAPPAPTITLAELNTFAASFSELNDQLAGLAAALSIAIKERYDAFDLLNDKNQDIKAAVLAQYGIKSAEYKSIKGIKS